VLQHIAEWLSALCVNLIKLGDEAKSRLEVILEGHHLCIVLEADHRQVCAEGHVIKRFLVSQLKESTVFIERVEGEARHLSHIIRLVPRGVACC